MQKLIIKFVLSLVLTMSLISCMFNIYNNLSETNKTTKIVIVEAPLYLTPVVQSFWRAVKYWFVGSGGGGKSPLQKPSG